jgi:hypothetical protein
MSDVILMPGAVGLSIVDSFTSRIPLFTIDNETHGPEIAYLENGVNGVMTEDRLQSYIAVVARYLNAPTLLARLREGCATSAKLYSLDNMVRNFSAGIEACLLYPHDPRAISAPIRNALDQQCIK